MRRFVQNITLLVTVTIVLVSGIVACSKQPDTRISGARFISIDYTGIMTRVSPGADPELFYADQALENNIHVWPSLGFKPYKYEREIDWSFDGYGSRSWQLYFHSLRVVGYLANAAEVSGDSTYLEKAGEIIESWFDFHYNNASPPRYAWYDHSVANRVRNITHFLRAYASLPDISLPDSLFEKTHIMLQEHGTWLAAEKNYAPYNHGMMASMALTQLALTFPHFEDSELWAKVGIDRIRERIEADLSAESVHKEHSPGYHIFFLDLIITIDDYLKAKNVHLFQSGDRTMEKMLEYVAYMVKPNHYLPTVGDTSSSSQFKRNYGHPWVTYLLSDFTFSDGLEGMKPPQNSVVYPDAGIAILRDEWKFGNESAETTYLMFQSAFHSTYHKHADDLGFVLYSHGEDIFVDPGIYAYDTSEYQQYVRSTQAHNSLTVDGDGYPITRNNMGKANITAHLLDEAFDFVQGNHTMYDGVTLRRGIILVRPSTILIIDEAISETQHKIQQIFNLGPEAHDLKFDKDRVSFQVGDKGVSVEIQQLCGATSIRHYQGQEDPVRGFVSPRFEEVVPVHQLEFENYGHGVVFVTQISVTESGGDKPTISVDCGNPYRKIEVSDGKGVPLIIDLAHILE